MGAVAGLIGLPGTGRTIAVADDGAGERVGGRDARRPACADGAKSAPQGNQDKVAKTTSAIRRIANPSASDLNHHESEVEIRFPELCCRSKEEAGKKRCVLQL